MEDLRKSACSLNLKVGFEEVLNQCSPGPLHKVQLALTNSLDLIILRQQIRREMGPC